MEGIRNKEKDIHKDVLHAVKSKKTNAEQKKT